MHNITLRKQDGASYRSPLKVYDVTRNGEVVGTVGQDLWDKWSVVTAADNLISRYTTKAAARGESALMRALWLDVEVYADREEELQALSGELAEERVDDELPPIIQDEGLEWNTWVEAV